jgi:beta-glucosidase
MNEPLVFVGAGYFLGLHAPGKYGLKHFLPAMHHVNLANAQGIRLLQDLGAENVGTALSFASVHPYDESDKNYAAAHRVHTAINHNFLDPMLGKGYPNSVLPFLDKMDKYQLTNDDILLRADPDFWGVQVYTLEVVKHASWFPYLKARIISPKKRNKPISSLGQELYCQALSEILVWFIPYTKSVNAPVYITECGVSVPEILQEHPLDDSYRINYYNEVISSLAPYIQSEELRSLYFWSLIDYFVQTAGYTVAFELFHLAIESFEINGKESAYWANDLMEFYCLN